MTRGGDLIEENKTECRPERIPRKCLDNVCISQIRKYFSFDAWNLKLQWIPCVLKVVGLAVCSVCHTDLHSSESICCDGCLDWVNLKCTGQKRAPKSKH